MAVALARVLRRHEPVPVSIDGSETDIALIFVGNGRYLPAGFTPSWRPRLDDPNLDVRIVDTAHPWSRTRLLLAVLTGSLSRSRGYRRFTATELHIRSQSGPLRLALDGETSDAGTGVRVRVDPRPLAVYRPHD